MSPEFKVVTASAHLTLLAMVLVRGQGEPFERKPYLSRYQDAWKALTVPGRYYLYMRSYEEEPFYGTNKKCVSSELLAVNEKENCTTNIFRVVGPKDGTTSNRTAYAWARATESYSTANVILSSPTYEYQARGSYCDEHSSPKHFKIIIYMSPCFLPFMHSEKDFVLEYAVAFSEYYNCDILRLPHRRNGCELWLKAGEIHNVKSICLFLFDLLCGPEKYSVYDRDLCEGT